MTPARPAASPAAAGPAPAPTAPATPPLATPGAAPARPVRSPAPATPGGAPAPGPSETPPPDALEGGFADPPAEAARAFRAILDAMARPGRVHALAGARPPAPLPPAAGVAALTLLDAETPLLLAFDAPAPAAEAWLRFHAGAPLAAAPEAAAFALGPPEALAPVLDRLPAGEPDWPDRSATLLVLVPTLAEGSALRLSGPGVDGTARLPLGPARDAVAALAAPNRGAFPLGRDLILLAGDRVAALPRSVRLSPED